MPEEMDLGMGIALPFVHSDTGVVAAVFYWHGFAGRDVQMSGAADSPRWATRGNIKLVVGFPFLSWSHIMRVSTIQAKGNRRARRLVEWVGFKHEGTHPALFKSGAGLSFGMTRRWWFNSRWGPTDGQKSTLAA